MSESYYFDGYDFDDEGFIEEPNELISNEEEDVNVYTSFDPEKTTSTYHIKQAEKALKKLKSIIEENDWKKVLNIKSGVAVYSKDGSYGDDKVPIFMSEHIVENFTPHAIFAVIGMRKLWDPWYDEGNLVENLDNTTSLTYMTMQALAGTRTRDLSLVEKIEYTSDGTIYFATTSVQTPKVPLVIDRIRAHLNLNGWVIKPISKHPLRTKLTYILQSKVGGWVPSVVARRYLIRRPLVVYTIDQYLRKNGSTSLEIGSTTSSALPSRRTSNASSVHPLNNLNNVHIDLKKPVSKDRKEPQNRSTIQNIPPRDFLQPKNRDTIEETPVNSYDEDVINSSSTQDTIENQKSPTLTSMTGRSPVQAVNNKPVTPPASSVVPLRTQSSKTSLNGKKKKFIPPPLTLHDDKKESPVSPQPPQKKHRYKNVINKAVTQFKENVNSMDGWQFYSESKGVKIYTKDIEGRTFPIIRGDYTLSGGFTANDCLAILKNLSLRKLWDDRFDGGENIEILSNTENTSRVSMKGTFPISGRDFALFGTVEQDPITGKIVYVTTSIIDQAIPEVKKYVRAHITFAGWQMVPNFDSKGNTESLSLVYIVDSELKLDSIPSSILKTLSTGTPMIVQKIDEMLHETGFPPYILKSTSLIISEDLEPKTFQGDLLLIADSNSVTEVRFSRKMYPNGFILTVNPDSAKIELLPNNSDTIRLTLPSKVNTKKLHITITKSTGRGFKLTYNEGKTINEIPADTKDEVREIPVTISRNTNNEIKTRPKPAENITKHQQHSEEPPQPEELTQPEKPTQHEPTQPEESPQLEKPLQPEEPVTLTRQTRTAHSTSSSTNATLVANGTIDINVLNDHITDNNEVLNRITSANIRRVVSPETFQFKEEPQEPYQQLDEKHEKQEDEIEKRVESFEKHNINHHSNRDSNDIIIISENIGFNIQEISLMFAAMLISYYAGKLSFYFKI
ncbi:3292_t:CDS:2 [Funneliformis geosporum]|uniref:1568_t:CDS:1 n=1 Tax=Funneliformis geosporum TaxID=1117311 RepID=A0A9W4SGF0_9GLOM|nr:3292_t:CDS:2 [Funneliformis geosporum]CAI2168644.1 1568_t:CDS:2 [Funneliformis geosporum]